MKKGGMGKKRWDGKKKGGMIFFQTNRMIGDQKRLSIGRPMFGSLGESLTGFCMTRHGRQLATELVSTQRNDLRH
jgi:hypothetical protein